ncbi:hypothetical protein OIU76_006453 [Salix suchowensis]|nr:hypothetical protein OIU76_006453 [Salix suchowensis]
MAKTRKVYPAGAVLLIINLLMASRIPLSRSILLLQRTNNHFPRSHFTPKRFPKSYPCPLWSSSFSSCLQTLHQSSTTTATTPPFISTCYSSFSKDPITDEANPLLQDFEFPPFDVVEASHVRPGIRAILKNLESDLEELERTVEPSWPKLAVKDSPELRAAIEEVQPEKVKFQLRLGQSKPIYNAFKAIQDSPQWSSLSGAQKRIVESQIKEAVLNGVALDDDKREQFNKIEQELERLSQKFGENVLDATKKFEKLITDKKDIEGLPATSLGLAAQTAVSKGHTDATVENGPWIITLDAPSFMSVMQHARNRGLREEIYRAYVTRASSGDLNNTAIIDEILKLRLEKAKLLGYNNYAEVSMATKMATVEKAEELLEKLRKASWDAAVQDMEDLKNFLQKIKVWFGTMMLNSTASKIPWAVQLHTSIFDPYSRPSEKRGGAWMDEVVSRSRVLSPNGTAPRLPIAHMVCNQTPPVGKKPSLMTFREVETVFHEFGHALQHMLTKQDEGLVAGIRGIEWDAVELPSQFMENWCYHRETLMGIAKHYETGETLPEEVYSKLLAARTFRAGSFSLRQIKFASLDLELHTNYIPGALESIYDVDQRVSKRTQVIPPLTEDRFLCGFSHIFCRRLCSWILQLQVG